MLKQTKPTFLNCCFGVLFLLPGLDLTKLQSQSDRISMMSFVSYMRSVKSPDLLALEHGD